VPLTLGLGRPLGLLCDGVGVRVGVVLGVREGVGTALDGAGCGVELDEPSLLLPLSEHPVTAPIATPAEPSSSVRRVITPELCRVWRITSQHRSNPLQAVIKSVPARQTKEDSIADACDHPEHHRGWID
jgi:hypothetical protein